MGEIEIPGGSYQDMSFEQRLRTIVPDDPLAVYYGLDVHESLLRDEFDTRAKQAEIDESIEAIRQEFARKRAAAIAKQVLLDNTWYATPGGLRQRRDFYTTVEPAQAETAEAEEPVLAVALAEAKPEAEVVTAEAVVEDAVRSLRKQELVSVGGNL